MVRIAFDVYYLRSYILRLVSEGVDDDTATDGAIRAC